MDSNKKFLYFLIVFFFSMLLFNIFNKSINPNDEINYINENRKETNKIFTPNLTDGITSYESNWGYINYETFSSTGDLSEWTITYDGGSVDISTASPGYIWMEAVTGGLGENPSVEYSAGIYPFNDGYLYFRYRLYQATSATLRVDIIDSA